VNDAAEGIAAAAAPGLAPAEAASAADAAAAGPPAASKREIRRAMAGLMTVLALASLDGNIVGPALPRIVSDLGGLSHLSWVVTAFAVASTASTPLYGKLSDQFGRRPAFGVSIGVFLIGSVLCGASHSMIALIASRALQGAGAGGLLTLSQTTIADLVSPRERGRYQGQMAGVFALCSVAGPLLGGVITDTLSWPWIFYINLPIGAAALAILAVSLRRGGGRPGRGVDWTGFGLLIGGTCALLLLLSWGGAVYPWRSAPILALGAATLLLFGLLVPVERQAREPALPPHLFTNRVFVTGVATISLTAASLFGALVFIPLFFQLVLGASATEAGLRMAPLMGGIIVSSLVGGRLVTRTGKYKRFPVIGLAVGTLAYAAMAYATWHGTSATLFDALLTVLGLGIGLIMPNITTAVQNAVVPANMGVATSTLGFFRSLGGALGVAVAGMILSVSLRAGPPGAGAASQLGLSQVAGLPPSVRADVLHAYSQALALTFAAAAIVTALAFGTVLLMPERPLRSNKA
jgi:EmrB/QacA subfamily drug resistance transporter